MRKLARFACGFAFGCAACVLGLPVFYALIVSGGLALAFFLLRSHADQKLRPVVLGLCFALLWCAGYKTIWISPMQSLCREGQRPITATAEAYPTATRYGKAVLVRVKEGGISAPAVLYYPDDAEIRPGDEISCLAKVRAASPDDLGRDEYYASRGVWMTVSCKEALKITPGKESLRYFPEYAARRLKEAIRQVFPADASGFLTALLTGDKHDLSYRTRNELSLAGIYHVVAVSGMHVSLLSGLVMLLFAGRRKLAAMLGLPLVWFFVLLTGANASSVRAGVMQTVLLLAPLANRETDTPTAFAAALTLLLAQNPWSLRNVGLLLSFSSTGGILLFSGPLFRAIVESNAFCHLKDNRPKLSRTLERGVTAFCCSVAASAFSLPICAYYFRLFSLSGFLTNALLLWLVSLVFSIGLPIAALAVIAPGLMMGPAWVLSFPVRLILWAVREISRLPYGAVSLENRYACVFAVFFYAALWLVCLKPKKIKALAALAAILGTYALCMSLSALDYRSPAFSFTALDVGQGQCLVYTQGDQTSVFDCGGKADESGELAARYLTANGVFSVERLVLTHLDADHCNGAAQLLSRVRVSAIYLPAGARTEENALLDEILLQAQKTGTQVFYVEEDLEFSMPDGNLSILAPLSVQSGNDGGLCVLASQGKYDILVTGDLSTLAEYRLLSTHELRDIELLVAGHHGAETSTSEALLKKTGASTVVISVGQGNSYGHPSRQTLSRIEAVGADIYRTDTMGSIVIRGGTNGKETDGR